MSERFISVKCQSCGAKLDVCDIQDRFACRYCGAEMMAQRHGGTVSLKTVKGAPAAGAARTVSVGMAINWAKKKGEAYAEDYLRNYRFQKLGADIDDTTSDRIANAVADAYARSGTYDNVVAAIKVAFTQATDVRAAMIARTVLGDAYNSAMLDSAKEVSGLYLKTWAPSGKCCAEICQPNVDAGPIPLDEPFPSGHQAPTGHLGCDCSIAFVKAKK
jgi:DNA-directed RNA polymerase subunit RPC12/RpoP